MTIQVLPFTSSAWHAAHAGPFSLFEFADQDPIVHLEHFRAGVFLRNVKDVRDCRKAVTELRGRAMSPARSRDFIRGRAEEIESELR